MYGKWSFLISVLLLLVSILTISWVVSDMGDETPLFLIFPLVLLPCATFVCPCDPRKEGQSRSDGFDCDCPAVLLVGDCDCDC